MAGQDRPDSQLTRRERMERDHPEVRIAFQDSHWEGVILAPSSEIVIGRPTLNELLDRLEHLLGPQRR